jgi:superfamily II DNA or RNA helicase
MKFFDYNVFKYSPKNALDDGILNPFRFSNIGVEMDIEIPHSTKIWIKNGFEWDLTYHEADDFEDEFGDWEDPEWNDYE